MLKRLSAALALFSLCFVVSAVSARAVCKSAGEIRRPLALCIETLKEENTEKTASLIRESTDKFRQKQTLFDVLLSHEKTSELSSNIFSLEDLSKNGDSDAIKEKISDCIAVLERIEDEQKVKIGNIF